MSLSRNIVITFFIFFLAISFCKAEEGMWPIYDINKLPFDKMKEMGLELNVEDIYNPDGLSITDAIVDLAGGSSSFVSENGLIITNHHVAYGGLQRNSTLEMNYAEKGFYAENLEDEIPAIGYTVDVLLSIEDRTEEVLSVVKNTMTDKEKNDAIEKKINEIINKAEQGRDVRCSLRSMYEGNQYILFTAFQIKDVRIVYAPPYSIGAFGGDIDNWMWPRHCGDFAFVRAYVAPDGSSASYSEKNIPYKPRNFLPLSSKGVKEGDFTMLMGFPGRTSRYELSARIEYLYNKYYPLYIKTSEDRLAILEEESAKDSSAAIRLLSKKSGINNFMKKARGIQAGFRRFDVVEKKKTMEKQLNDFINGNTGFKQEYGDVIYKMDSLNKDYYKNYLHNFVLDYFVDIVDYMYFADHLYRWSVEREKPDSERESGFQDRDKERLIRRLNRTQINLVTDFDKRTFLYIIMKALSLPSDQRIEAVDRYFGTNSTSEEVEKKIDAMYAQSKMNDWDYKLSLLDKSKNDQEQLGDPFIDLAVLLRPELDEMENREEAFDGAILELQPKLFNMYAEWKNGKLYPNANGTLRFNYGQVMGYAPCDGVEYKYYTTLEGIIEKNTNEFPFIVPDELETIYDAKDYGQYYSDDKQGVPVNFITNNSGTNGSSGSAVINGKGELVGIDFDTGYEGVMADYWYSPDVCRAVCVDVQYVLFIIDKVYHLDKLKAELTIH